MLKNLKFPLIVPPGEKSFWPWWFTPASILRPNIKKLSTGFTKLRSIEVLFQVPWFNYSRCSKSDYKEIGLAWMLNFILAFECKIKHTGSNQSIFDWLWAKAKCGSGEESQICGGGWQFKSNKDDIECTGDKCTNTDDKDKCCDETPKGKEILDNLEHV